MKNKSCLSPKPERARFGFIALILGGILVAPPGAYAHHLMNSDKNPFMGGLTLPIHGGDHILAMIAVGMWAVLVGKRGRWLIPASFMALMLVGITLGVLRINVGSWVETGVALSACALGLIIAFLTRLPLALMAVIAGFFAVLHGYACGADLPQAWAPYVYGLGLILCTVILIAGGYVLGGMVKKLAGDRGLRIAGGCLAAMSAYLLVTG